MAIYSRVDTTLPVVALTFDDGPSMDLLPFLDLLEGQDWKATFFWTGRPELEPLRIVRSEGHEVGSHGFRHSHARERSDLEMRIDWDKSKAALGYDAPVRWFRPPYGEDAMRWDRIVPVDVAHWSLDTRDYDDGQPRLSGERAAKARPGDIILMHEGCGTEHLNHVIAALTKLGLHSVTLSELLYTGLETKT